MASHAELTLLSNLNDTDAVEELARQQISLEIIPTEELRPIVSWTIDQFFASGLTKAPSRAALLDVHGDTLEQVEIELVPEDEETDSISWAIDHLKSQYTLVSWQTFAKQASRDMAEATGDDRVTVLAKTADTLFELLHEVENREGFADAKTGIRESLRDYEAREQAGHIQRGIMFGWDEVDEHTYGIHEGELAILAAGPKVGKSMTLARAAWYDAWERGRCAVLFSLENSVEMTYDRMICMHLKIDFRRYQRGECDEGEMQRITDFRQQVEESDVRLYVIQPEMGQRTPEAMVRRARLLNADSLFIDQLTFVEHPRPGQKPRNVVIAEIMHQLKVLVSTGRHRIPLLLAHQINRDGVRAAEKTGFLQMYHLAESSEVERTADWVFGLYQDSEEMKAQEAKFQVLAARREALKVWVLAWRIGMGMAKVLGEMEVPA